MMRQSSSRNQRTKGMRTKTIIQICLLASVSIWLLYQLKHSYDKRRLSGDRSSRKLNDVFDSHAEFIKLGRKDLLLPQSELTNSPSDANNKDEEKEEVEEDEDPELSREMEAVEREQVGDDDIDEQDHEREDEQEDQDMANDESETGEDTTNEEDKDDQVEEAREESYKKDDASSAVHRENLEAKSGNENVEQSETNAVKIKGNVTELEDMTILKDDAAEDSSGSGVVDDPKVENNTNSNSMNITGNAFEKRQIEENQNELNTTALLVSENQEKLNLVESSNQTAAAPFNLSNLGEGINNHTPIHNPYVESNPVVDNNAAPDMQAQENTRPTVDIVAAEPAHESSITIALRKTEPADFSHQIATEGEKEGHANLSNLPENIQTGVASIQDGDPA